MQPSSYTFPSAGQYSQSFVDITMEPERKRKRETEETVGTKRLCYQSSEPCLPKELLAGIITHLIIDSNPFFCPRTETRIIKAFKCVSTEFAETIKVLTNQWCNKMQNQFESAFSTLPEAIEYFNKHEYSLARFEKIKKIDDQSIENFSQSCTTIRHLTIELTFNKQDLFNQDFFISKLPLMGARLQTLHLFGLHKLVKLSTGLTALTSLALSCPLISEIPNDLFSLKHLRLLSPVKMLPTGLTSLEVLETGSYLEELPNDLYSLKELNACIEFADCKIKKLPTGMTSLKSLHLSRTIIKELPNDLISLTDLNLSGKIFPLFVPSNQAEEYTFLKKLPNNLISLKNLVLKECVDLEALPDEMNSLTSLHISKCNLLKLPKKLDSVESLLWDTTEGFQCKTNDEWIFNTNTDDHIKLPDMPALKTLVLRSPKTNSLGSRREILLPDSLTGLTSINADGCLKRLPRGMNELRSLFLVESNNDLVFNDLISVSELTLLVFSGVLQFNPTQAAGIKTLKLQNCDLSILGNFKNLSSLCLGECDSIFPNISSSLTSLTLSSCKNLVVPGSLVNLSSLELVSCENLQISNELLRLKSINFRNCTGVSLPEGLTGLTSILCCAKLVNISSLNNLPNPISLNLSYFHFSPTRESSLAFSSLTNLSSLNLVKCDGLRFIDNLVYLKSLTLEGCANITFLNGLTSLTSFKCSKHEGWLKLPENLPAAGALKYPLLGS